MDYDISSTSRVKISSGVTFFRKRVLPGIWFGVAGLVFLFALFTRNPLAAASMIVMAVFGYVLMKNWVFDLADEVWDCGDSLIVKDKGTEQRFVLAEFSNVSYSGTSNPTRITLTLRQPTGLGPDVSFIPRGTPTRSFRLSRPYVFAMHPIAKDLIERIDEAKMNRR